MLVPLALAALIGWSVSSAGQQQTLAGRVVLVTVAAAGKPLVELGVDDFVVEEAGKPHEILDVHMADYPLVVLIDDGAEAPGEIEVIREAVARFVSRVGERGVAVGTLAEPAAMVTTFDDERAVVLAKIREVTARKGAPLAPLDAIGAAVRMIRETGSPFSAVVVISARSIASAELGNADLLTPILESRAAVHVIARRPAAVPERDGAASAASDVLRDLGTLTHGQYTTIYSSASYAIALDRLADRLAAEMMIQYLTPTGSTPAGDVRVGVKVPGARVTGLGVSR